MKENIYYNFKLKIKIDVYPTQKPLFIVLPCGTTQIVHHSLQINLTSFTNCKHLICEKKNKFS